jgi:hypothetical protein
MRANRLLIQADAFYRRYAKGRRLLPRLAILVVLVGAGLLIAHDWLHGTGVTLGWLRALG